GLDLGQVEGGGDAAGAVQKAEAVGDAGFRGEGDGTEAARGARFVVRRRVHLGDDFRSGGDRAADVQRLAGSRRAANVNAVGNAGEQLAPFREELDEDV